MTTAETLREKYRNDGYSRRAFAKAIAVPEGTIRRFESGETVSPASAKKIADYLECKVTDLMPFEQAA